MARIAAEWGREKERTFETKEVLGGDED